MVIYIVRHGETEENLQHLLQGHMPGTLTEKGKEQVRKTAEDLAQRYIGFSHIVSSDLKRAMDSAQIISDKLGIPVVPNPLLRERDWGKYTGISISEARDKYHHHGHWDFPDSVETEEAILERAKKALKQLEADYGDCNIIVVTHGLFARNLIAANFDCSYKEVNPMFNAEIRVLTKCK